MTPKILNVEDYLYFVIPSFDEKYDYTKFASIRPYVQACNLSSYITVEGNTSFGICINSTLTLTLDTSIIDIINSNMSGYIGIIPKVYLLNFKYSYMNIINILHTGLCLYKILTAYTQPSITGKSSLISAEAISVNDLCKKDFHTLKLYFSHFFRDNILTLANFNYRETSELIVADDIKYGLFYKIFSDYNLGVPMIDQIIFNEPNTVVKWKDGTTTIVSVAEDDTFSKEHGLAMAIAKKYFESYDLEHPRSAFKKAVNSATDYSEKTKSKRSKKKGTD